MLKLFKKNTFYARIYCDRIVLRFIENNKTIDRVSIIKFSNKRMVLANFESFESFFQSLIKEMTSISWHSSNRILLQVMEKLEDGLSTVELRALKDSGMLLRMSIVKIYTKTDFLSDSKVFEIINSGNSN